MRIEIFDLFFCFCSTTFCFATFYYISSLIYIVGTFSDLVMSFCVRIKPAPIRDPMHAIEEDNNFFLKKKIINDELR